MPLFMGGRKQLLQQQRGIVLITVLVFLAIMTLLGITNLNTNILEERMAANGQETGRALQAAEAGIAAALSDSSDYVSARKNSASVLRKAAVDVGGGMSYVLIYKYLGVSASGKKEHFEVKSEGSTDTGGSVTIVAGFSREI